MNSFVSLCRREWLEHRNAFVLGPAILVALLVVSVLIALVANDNLQVEMSSLDRSEISERVDLEELEGAGAFDLAAAAALDVAGSTDLELELKLDKLLNAVAVPFHWVLMVITFFALLSALYDERKDQSILFWKSLPVTSSATVLSKYVFIALLAPMVSVAGIVIAQLIGLSVSSVFVEDGMAETVRICPWLFRICTLGDASLRLGDVGIVLCDPRTWAHCRWYTLGCCLPRRNRV